MLLIVLMGEVIRAVEDNVEATEAWNGPLFDVWIEYRDIVAEGLRNHGEAALAADPPGTGDRALDIGCGLGTPLCAWLNSSVRAGTRMDVTSPSA